MALNLLLRQRILSEISNEKYVVSKSSPLSSSFLFSSYVSYVEVIMKKSNIPSDKLEDVLLSSLQLLCSPTSDLESSAKTNVEIYLKSRNSGLPEEHSTGSDHASNQQDTPLSLDEDRKNQSSNFSGSGSNDSNSSSSNHSDSLVDSESSVDDYHLPDSSDSSIDEDNHVDDDHESFEDNDEDPPSPDYIPPNCWDKVESIIQWNLEHPGKQKNIMLVGPRGVGKTEMVFQLSQRLFNKNPYALTSPQSDFKLTGYSDAMGREIRSAFTKGYTEPGIILIEEIDRSEPSPLIAINMATANHFMDAPVRGLIEQNPKCTIIATANTSGTGANEEYVTANQLDASTRDRWIYILVNWEHDIALKLAKGDIALVNELESWNSSCEYNSYISARASYRSLIDIKDLMEMGFSYKDAIKSALIKYSLPKSNLQTIIDGMPTKDSSFSSILKEICYELPDNESMMG